MSIRQFIPSPVKKLIKPIYMRLSIGFFYIKRKYRKFKIRFNKGTDLGTRAKKSNTFAILCIKKEVYGEMTLMNINSLHYQNPLHTFIIYCDSICFKYLSLLKSKFDYPEKVTLKLAFSETSKPWQYYKIETIIETSKNNQILIDADSIWHDDPIVDKDKITIFVKTHKIKDDSTEKSLVENIFINSNEPDELLTKSDWGNFIHYVTAFLSIPSKFMTNELDSKLKEYNDKIFSSDLNFIENKDKQNHVKRLCEEISVNLALQAIYSADNFTTLQDNGDPGNKTLLEPLYYGCLNNITT